MPGQGLKTAKDSPLRSCIYSGDISQDNVKLVEFEDEGDSGGLSW